MAQQLEAQRAHVSSLRSELAESEAEHGELVRQLHSQLPAKEVPVDKPALSIDDILDAERLSKMLDLSANGVFRIDELEYELTPEDTQELESRAAQLREGIQTLAASLFKDSKTKVDALRAEHDAHIKRLAAKRRRGEAPPTAAASTGATAPSAAAPAPVVGEAPAAGSGAAPGAETPSAEAGCSIRERADAIAKGQPPPPGGPAGAA
eukprot:9391903-Pyramimonas_sp.AAC.1